MKRLRLATFSLTCLASLAWTAGASADSPLTSTDFHTAYRDVPAVQHAQQAGLDARTIAALRDANIPSDVRAAIVNALGWNIDGQHHARAFLAAVARARRTTPQQITLAQLSTEELFALGYLRAMDDYSDLRPIGGRGEAQKAIPGRLLAEALGRAPTDATMASVLGLVRAQMAMMDQFGPGGFCGTWQEFARAEAHPRIQTSFRPQARQVILGYMNSYQSYCR